MQQVDACLQTSRLVVKRRVNQLKRVELSAVEKHKYYLSVERGEDVGIDVALEDWDKHYAREWHARRLKVMNQLQRQAIKEFKWCMSEEAGYDVGSGIALVWVDRYAPSFREWFENDYFCE